MIRPTPEGASYESTLPVLGVPVRLRSNEPELIAAFERSLGRWRVLEGRSALLSDARVEGALWVGAGEEGADRPIPARVHSLCRPAEMSIAKAATLLAVLAALPLWPLAAAAAPVPVRFAEGVRRDGITDVVLLGMGGSSLAPEVLRAVVGVAAGAPRFTMLDSTDPAAVAERAP